MECQNYYKGFAKGFEQGWKKAIEEINKTRIDGVELYKIAYNNALKDVKKSPVSLETKGVDKK